MGSWESHEKARSTGGPWHKPAYMQMQIRKQGGCAGIAMHGAPGCDVGATSESMKSIAGHVPPYASGMTTWAPVHSICFVGRAMLHPPPRKQHCKLVSRWIGRSNLLCVQSYLAAALQMHLRSPKEVCIGLMVLYWRPKLALKPRSTCRKEAPSTSPQLRLMAS